MNKFLFVLVFPFLLSAQLKGEVFDVETRKPIPYVNIWIEDENIGTNSEENGNFILEILEDKNIVFSAVGYETKTISSKEIVKVYLQPKTIQLNELVLEKPKGTEEIEIGEYEKSGFRYQLNYNKNAVFFKDAVQQKRCPFLKTIVFQTISEIKGAKIKVRILSIDENNLPGKDLLNENVVVSVKKGSKENEVDFSKYNFRTPKEGFFVLIEKLSMEENKVHYKVNYKNSRGEKVEKEGFKYEPNLAFVPSEKDNVWYARKDYRWEKSKKIKLKDPKEL